MDLVQAFGDLPLKSVGTSFALVSAASLIVEVSLPLDVRVLQAVGPRAESGENSFRPAI